MNLKHHLLCSILATATLLATGHTALCAEPPRPAFQALRFNENWSALGQMPKEQRTDLWDPIKYIPLTEDESIWLSFGGSARLRLESWRNFNFGAPPAGKNDDTFLLGRVFLHADLHLGPHVRIFAEGKSAFATDRRLVGGRRALDIDTLDLQNGFIDLRVPLGDEVMATLRAGRQELLFGRQRLVSPLDWANTRRTFDGFSGIVSLHGWSIHGFWAQPVRVLKYEFNTPESSADFFGVYATGPAPYINGTLDLYWLGLHREGPMTFNQTSGRERRHTLGARLGGRVGATGFDYDLEGAYQFGDVGDGDISAFMVATQIGYRFAEVWSAPRVFVGFDYASGDRSPGGNVQTFNQLFPLGHAYLGWIDAIGRQNIIALSSGVTFSPVERLTVDLHGHYFWRANREDALYNVGGGVSRPGAAGISREVGGEIDLLLRYQLDVHTQLMLGFSHFFAGDFVKESGPSRSMSFLYTGLEYRF